MWDLEEIELFRAKVLHSLSQSQSKSVHVKSLQVIRDKDFASPYRLRQNQVKFKLQVTF